jgi:hypothetical protein
MKAILAFSTDYKCFHFKLANKNEIDAKEENVCVRRERKE